MLVSLGGTHLVPGEVVCSASGVHGWLDVGCYPTGSNELCEAIAVDLRNAQFACEADPQVMMKKRTKLLSNVNNCLAIMGDDSGGKSKFLNDALVAEAEACYRAANMPYYPRDTFRTLRVERPDSPRGPAVVGEPFGGAKNLRGGSSTWQSLARGTGDIECDFLNGEISLLGEPSQAGNFRPLSLSRARAPHTHTKQRLPATNFSHLPCARILLQRQVDCMASRPQSMT